MGQMGVLIHFPVQQKENRKANLHESITEIKSQLLQT